jgi:hypothetical protein
MAKLVWCAQQWIATKKGTLLENMVLFYWQFEQALKRPFCHFGQVDFDMFVVIGVVFFY